MGTDEVVGTLIIVVDGVIMGTGELNGLNMGVD